MPRPLGPKTLQNRIELTLLRLMRGKNTLTKEERDEMRSNVNAATKFLAVKNKLKDSDWGSGFGKPNGEAKGGTEDERLDDED